MEEFRVEKLGPSVNVMEAGPVVASEIMARLDIDDEEPPGGEAEGAAASVAEEPGPVDLEQAGADLGPVLSFVMFMGFSVLAPQWGILKEEAEKLGRTWARVLVKWLPGPVLEMIPSGNAQGRCAECDALAATFEVFAPRFLAAPQEMPPGGHQEPPGPPAPPAPPAPRQPQPGAMVDVHGQ